MNSEASSPPRQNRSAAVALGAGSVLTVLLMAHHPAPRASDLAGLIAALERQAALAKAVHGALIALMAVVLYGFAGFAEILGWRHASVRAGMIAYSLGFLFLAGAAIAGGFVAPSFAAHFAGSRGARLESVAPALRLCWETNQALAETGTAFVSAAILAWSLALIRKGSTARVIGAAGLAVGALPLLGLVSGRLDLDVHGMAAVLLGEAAWNVAAAWWMMRTSEF